MGAQGHPQRRRFWEVLERPHDRSVRHRDLGCETLSGAMRRSRDDHFAPGRQTRAQGDTGRFGPAPTGILRVPAGSRRPRAAGRLWHQRTPRFAVSRVVHRSSHSRHHPGDLRLSAQSGHRRPALYGERHPCALRASPAHRARSTGGQRGANHHPPSGRSDADAGHLARDPGLQPLTHSGIWPTALSSPRRTIRPKTAGSNTTRSMAVRPTPTSPMGREPLYKLDIEIVNPRFGRTLPCSDG
jgi:hypothetical protein